MGGGGWEYHSQIQLKVKSGAVKVSCSLVNIETQQLWGEYKCSSICTHTGAGSREKWEFLIKGMHTD